MYQFRWIVNTRVTNKFIF